MPIDSGYPQRLDALTVDIATDGGLVNTAPHGVGNAGLIVNDTVLRAATEELRQLADGDDVAAVLDLWAALHPALTSEEYAELWPAVLRHLPAADAQVDPIDGGAPILGGA